MRSQSNSRLNRWWGLGLLLLLAVPGLAQAGPLTRLQILLPGELAAPGTLTGKTGVPEVQTVGVPFTLAIRACDDDWNTVLSVADAVSWHATDTSADLPENTRFSSGFATVQVTLNSAGTFTISGQDLSDPTIAEAVSANVTAVVLASLEFADINQKHHTAGEPFTISITATDPNGNPVGGFSGPVNLQQFTSFGLGRLSPESVTLDGGTWTGQISLFRADETNINRGNVTIYAFLPGDTSINGSSNPFLVHPGSFERVQIVVPGQTPAPGTVAGVAGTPASQGATQPFSVDLYSTDDYWNPVPANDVLRVVSSDDGASTPVTATLSDGTGSASVFLGSVGAQTLTVNDLSDGSIRAMTTAPIMVIPSYADHFEFEDLPAAVVAGTPVLARIHATDAGGNTIPSFNGDAVLTANTGVGSISPNVVTFINGQWSGGLTFFGAGGAVQVTCSDYSTPPHLGTSAPTQVLPGPYVATQVILPGQTALGGTADGIEGSPDTQDAGQEFVIQVRAVDRYFNRVEGINNPVTINSDDQRIVVPDNVSLVNGEVFVPVTIYYATGQRLSVSDAISEAVASPQSSFFAVRPGPYQKLLILAPGQQREPGATEGRTGTATDQSITYQFSLQIFGTDQWFNPIPTVGDIVHLASTDPGAELSPDTSLTGGHVSLNARLATGGFQQITVTSISNPDITASTTQVKAISSGLHLRAAIAENVVQAGVPFTLAVDMVNDAGSIIQEINSEVQLVVRNANTQAAGRGHLTPTAVTLENGSWSGTLTYDFAEPILLEVGDEQGSSPGLTGVLNVQPGPPSIITLSSDPGWVRANRTAMITAAITDEFGNPVPDQVVAFATAAGDSGSLREIEAKADDKSVISLTDEAGLARVQYHSPRLAQTTQVFASSGNLSAELGLQTALVDPDAPGGTITSYPNPFHPDEAATTIAYKLDDDASVRLRVYTVSGGLVLDRQYAAGDVGGREGLNEVQWDGRNGNGDPVASGGYIVYVAAEGNGATQHVMRRKIGVVW